MGHKCNGGPFCDGSHASTAAEDRAYRKLSREQKEEQHRLFKQSQRNHRAQYHGGCGLVIIAYVGVPAVLGSSTWLAFSGWLA